VRFNVPLLSTGAASSLWSVEPEVSRERSPLDEK